MLVFASRLEDISLTQRRLYLKIKLYTYSRSNISTKEKIYLKIRLTKVNPLELKRGIGILISLSDK